MKDNNNIFFYWENVDGSSGMPKYIELCLKSMWKNKGNCDITLLTPANVNSLLPGLRKDWSSIKKIAHKVDYLRPRMLETYGGAFLDIDAICMDSLDNFIGLLSKFDVCGFAEVAKRPHIGCLVARKGSQLMDEWAHLQDINFKLDADWTHYGTELLWNCTRFDNYGEYPLDFVQPFDWTLVELYDKPVNLDEFLKSRLSPPLVFALFNKGLDEKFKKMTEKELLSEDHFFGQCLLRSLA